MYEIYMKFFKINDKMILRYMHMKLKKLWLIPIILVIFSVLSSVVAFRQSLKLEEGYLYVDNEAKTTVYKGDYDAIIGNTVDVYYIEVSLLADYVEISTYDKSEVLLDQYNLKISLDANEHDASLTFSNVEDQKINIDEMEEYLLTISLDENQIYYLELEVVNNDLSTDDIDIAFVYIPEHVYNLKTLTEGIAFTTLIFAFISSLTIAAIIYVKKDR